MVACFVSADWGKSPEKRSVYIADFRARRIQRGEPPGASWDVDALLDLANRLARNGPVLVGVDVVLGVPQGYWRLVLEERRRRPPATFVEWLEGLGASNGFFETVVEPHEWRVDRPWFKVAQGDGGLTSFTSQVGDGMRRRVDIATHANPVFAVAGIPGTVGGGTRAFWKELIPHLSGRRGFAVWPFEGELSSLLEKRRVVLCETFPRLAYAAALTPALPTGAMRIFKTRKGPRNAACDRLARAEWVRAHGIDLGDLARPRANEDDFDAHLTAAAVFRCVHEGMRLDHPQWMDARVEGSMLLCGVVDPHRKSSGSIGKTATLSGPFAQRKRRAARQAGRSRFGSGCGPVYPCPIPGCGKVFSGSRSGWDAHVGSIRWHLGWRPEITDPEERKRAFREEFRNWFV